MYFICICRTASPCQIWSKSVKLRPRYGDDFSKVAAVCHPGFIVQVFRPPTKGIWWYLLLCKSLVGIGAIVLMHVFRFFKFCLKMPIHAPKIGVFGGFVGSSCRCDAAVKWGAISTKPKKAHPCRSPHYLARKSVDASDL